MSTQADSGRAFFAIAALLFAASAAATIAGSLSMPAMGGGAPSTAWVAMCGPSWPAAFVSFLGMWIAMTVAMMLPSLVPVLWRCRQSTATQRADRFAALVGAGYFCVWIGAGATAFALASALAALEKALPASASAAPLVTGVVVVAGGALQFTAWKARHLGLCRKTSAGHGAWAADARSAWRLGLRLGLHCIASCAGLTAILVAGGMMDLCLMALVATAITAERLAPSGEWIAEAVGTIAIAAGVFLMAQAAASA
jgi:predicted metal-binding membrane protein